MLDSVTEFCLLHRNENESIIEFNLYFNYTPKQITNPLDKNKTRDIIEAAIVNATDNGNFGILIVRPDSLEVIGRYGL